MSERPKRTRPRLRSGTRAQRDSTRPDPSSDDAALPSLAGSERRRCCEHRCADWSCDAARGTGERSVVLERKMSRLYGQVNARFMSSCVSNSSRRLSRALTNRVHKTRDEIVTITSYVGGRESPRERFPYSGRTVRRRAAAIASAATPTRDCRVAPIARVARACLPARHREPAAR